MKKANAFNNGFGWMERMMMELESLVTKQKSSRRKFAAQILVLISDGAKNTR